MGTKKQKVKMWWRRRGISRRGFVANLVGRPKCREFPRLVGTGFVGPEGAELLLLLLTTTFYSSREKKAARRRRTPDAGNG